MKKNTPFVIVMELVFFSVLLISCNTQKDEPSREILDPAPDDDGFKTVVVSDVTFRWKVEGTDLSCTVKAPTEGWVAAGFNSNPVMDGANLIIGYVEGTTVNMRDDNASGHAHSADAVDNIESASKSGSESGGITEIGFTIPLTDDANSQDFELVEGGSYYIILAYGTPDDFQTQHGNRYSVRIKL